MKTYYINLFFSYLSLTFKENNSIHNKMAFIKNVLTKSRK